MKNKLIDTNEMPKVLLVGIEAPYNKIEDIASYYEEFENLIQTNRITNYEKIFIKLREVSNSYFLSKGKLEEVKKICDEHNIEQVIFSEILSPQQERNLSDYLNCDVFDRTQLILSIFEKNALSAEGKIQVEIARLRHKKTRLSGKGAEMSQQTGISGKIGGAGETAKEKETRLIDDKVSTLRRKLENIKQVRETQRKTRFKSNVPQICLIGYTNTGKSTLLNILTKSNVLAENKLFATLDTATRELFIDGKKKAIISDSVGFIQQLPHNLIEAFKSTLEELQYADLLLQVVDVSDPNWESHIKVVHEILQELNVKKDMLYVFNKLDKALEKDNLKIFVNTLEKSKENAKINDIIKTKESQNESPEVQNESNEPKQELISTSKESQDAPQESQNLSQETKSISQEEKLNIINDKIKNYKPNILISAKSKDGIKPLIDFLKTWERN